MRLINPNVTGNDTREAVIILQMIDGFARIAASARQMAHSRKDPRWLPIAEAADAMKGNIPRMAGLPAMSACSKEQMLGRMAPPVVRPAA